MTDSSHRWPPPVGDLLGSSIGLAGARVVSALAGDEWSSAVGVAPAFVTGSTDDDRSSTDCSFGRRGGPAPADSIDHRNGQIRLAMTPEGALSLHDLESVDLLIVDLLSRGISRPSDRSPLVELIDRIAGAATVLASVPTTWLSSLSGQHERETLLERVTVDTVLDLGRPHPGSDPRKVRTGTLNTHVAMSVLHLRKGFRSDALTYLASLPSGSGPTSPATERLIESLVSRDDRPGLRTEWGFTRSIEDSTSWDPAWLHPDRQELVCEILADGRGRTVEELAQVLRGRRPPRGATGGGVRVLQARNITAGLPPAQDLELMPAGPSPDTLVQVRLGDVVGSISGPAGRWAVIPADYEGVIAGDHTVVIRLHDSSPVSARYLLTWLCSEAARPLFAVRGAVIKRLDLRELSRLPVPIVAEPMNLVDAQLLQLAEATSLVESKLDSLRSSQASIFGGLQTAEVGRRLAEVAAQAASTSAGLQRHDDLLTRVQDLYPYPVARNARALRLAQAPRARYDEILNTFESTLIFLALIALSWSRSIGATTPELENWRSKIHSGGASLGIWLGLTRSIAEFASARGSDMAGLAPAMSDNGRTGLRRSLDLLLTERNRTHGGRPQSDAVYGDRADETMPVLERALEAAAFLVGCELAYVDDVRPIEHPRGVRYAVTAQRAMGDHPDWDLLSFELTNVVFDGRFYLFLGSDVLPVAPFLIARRCDECRQRHVYCPDEVSKSRVRFNSIDRGHERRDDDLSMVEAVREAIPRPQGP